MIEIVINYDPESKNYKIYEPSTDSLMVSRNLTEALIVLNSFIKDSGLSDKDLLDNPEISYHLDSTTMRGIVEGNLKLMKRLFQAPSSLQSNVGQEKEKKRRGQFSSATGFKKAYKKFGGTNF